MSGLLFYVLLLTMNYSTGTELKREDLCRLYPSLCSDPVSCVNQLNYSLLNLFFELLVVIFD